MAELFTLEDLAAHRRSDKAYRPADELAARARATGLVRGFCGWHVAPTQTDVVTVTIRDAGPGGWTFALPTMHLTAEPVITLPDASVPTDFTWGVGGYVNRLYAWGIPGTELSVSMTHGFPDGSYQHELVKGVAVGVAARFLDGEVQPAGSANLTAPAKVALTPEEEEQLSVYRLIPIA
jgi:hypothetical protein